MAGSSFRPVFGALLVLLGFSLNAMADESNDDVFPGADVVSSPTAAWDQVSSDDYAQHTVVYAGLVDAAGTECAESTYSGVTIYAFVGDECRGSAQFTTYAGGTSAMCYYALRVGGTDADQGKAITFKAVANGAIYTLSTADNSTINYAGDATVGTLSKLKNFVYNPITSISLRDFTVNVGETQTLSDSKIMTISPDSAMVPDNFEDLCTWDCANAADYGEIVTGDNGAELKGLKSTGGFGMYLALTCEALDLGASTNFIVYQPITSVSLKDGYTASTTAYVGDYTTLSNYIANCYSVEPEDADTKLMWATEDATIVDIQYMATNGSTQAQPLAAGTVKLYLNEATRDETGAWIAGDKTWLTLDVTVEVKPESINAQIYDVYAGVGQDITDIIKANYSITPADATNKNVTITIEGGKTGEIVVEEQNGKYITTGTGLSFITVTSVANPSAYATFNVYVNEIPTVTATESELTYKLPDLPASDELYAAITGNITVTPEGTTATITPSADTEDILNANWGLTGNVGSAVVNASVSYQLTELAEDGTLATNNKTAEASFKVTVAHNPITGVELVDGATDTYTAYVGDNTSLTNYLETCYAVTPANTDTKLMWVSEDATIVNIESLMTTVGIEAQPLKVGTVNLNLTEATMDETGAWVAGDKTWLTLNVTVEVKPESINAQIYDVYADVDQDITDIINANYSFTPAEATNKDVTITIEAGKTGEIVVEEKDGKYMTTGTGLSSVTVTSVANPSASVTFNVFVDKVQTVTIKNPTLNYLTTKLPETEDFWEDVANNIEQPETELYPTITNDGDVAVYDLEVGGLTGEVGSATFTYSYEYTRTQLNDGVLTNENLTASTSFKVVVSEGLTNIYLAVDGETTESLDPVKGESLTFTLVTEPADYVIDEDLIGINLTSAYDETQLTFADLQKNEDGSYTITTNYPGSGQINITYEGEDMGSYSISSNDKITIESGWAWYTFLEAKAVEDYFGEASENKIEEMRSQDQLLYNDPVFGYFGDINEVIQRTCYKVKANETFDVTYPMEYVDLEWADEITLNPKYNWIPNHYVAPHAVADAFAESTPNSDDVILSCSGDIATWTGTAWTGTLTTLQPYTGYIYYNAGTAEEVLTYAAEKDLSVPSAGGAKARRVAAERQESVWTYDRSQYPNVMAIIATVDGIDNTRRFSIGAFVGNECRGEGTCVDGKFYIGVSGKSGEKVTFKLFDDVTGEYADITDELPFAQLVGSYSKPVGLTADMTTTGITTATTSALHSDADAYNTMGVRVNSNAKGIIITKDGKKYLNK